MSAARIISEPQSLAGMFIRGRLGRGAELDYEEQRDHPMPSWVYFVRAGESAVKIGRCIDIAQRLSALQIANHEELVLAAKLPGSEPMERACQKHCAAARIRGEWFALRPKVERMIDWVTWVNGLAAKGLR